jgi:hypothetical protein
MMITIAVVRGTDHLLHFPVEKDINGSYNVTHEFLFPIRASQEDRIRIEYSRSDDRRPLDYLNVRLLTNPEGTAYTSLVVKEVRSMEKGKIAREVIDSLEEFRDYLRKKADALEKGGMIAGKR